LPAYDNALLLELLLGTGSPAGAFCKLFANLVDIDPAADNDSPQATFIDDGTPPLGCYAASTGGAISPNWSYGVPAGHVVNYEGGISFGQTSLRNEIWSPEITWDLQGTADDLASELELQFDVFEHNPFLNAMFWTWRIRSYPDPISGGWSDWKDNNLVYYSETARYATKTIDVSSLLVPSPSKVQVALGVWDWAFKLGYAGADATPAPWFDNVALERFEPAFLADACSPEIPPHSQTVGFGSRGLWFEAPSDLHIVGVRAPSELVAGDQAIEILQIHAEPSSFQYPLSSTDFTSLARFDAVPGSGVIPLALDVTAGTRIGLLGGRTPDGTSTQASYSAALPGPFASSIGPFDVNLYRLGSDESVANQPVQSIFYSPSSELGRIELFIQSCNQLRDCNCQAQWTAVTPADPGSLSGHGMVYDPVRDEVLLFGGYDGSAFHAGTWTWNGSDWTQRNPLNSPSARADFGLCYDSSRGVAVLYGGSTASGKVGDTWEWNGSDWSQIVSANSSAQSSMGLAYDAVRQVVVRYGGDTDTGRSRSTYEYDGSSWTTISDNSPPGYRSRQIMVFDPELSAVVVFGGQAPGGTLLADTWKYDGSWMQLSISGPSARQLARADTDEHCGRIYVHGGITSSGNSDELWILEAGAWAGPMTSAPAARYRHGLAFDAGRAALLVYGGVTESLPTADFSRLACASGVTATHPDEVSVLLTNLHLRPNPFNPRVEIRFELARPAVVEADVFDLRGRHVRTLFRGARESGPQVLIWDGHSDSGRASVSGVYIARIRAGGANWSQKLTLLR
jgi:hypothetical protein